MYTLQKYRNANLHSDSDDEDQATPNDPIYKKYNFNLQPKTFPILAHRNEILRAVQENFFIVLEGPTGCGKTTQVPQYILDDAYEKGKSCNILVAQPRRIAASSNAERVAAERKLAVGSLIGYKIGFEEEKHANEDTRILYCTTGVLLSKLIRAKHFCNYTHIILDEIHERNKDMDFLFVVIRKLFATAIPQAKVKVILMSATIQATQVIFRLFSLSASLIDPFFCWTVFQVFFIPTRWPNAICTNNTNHAKIEIYCQRIFS